MLCAMVTKGIEQELLRVLLEACPNIIELAASDGTLVYLNKAAAQRQSIPVADVLGTNIWSLYRQGQAAHRKTLANKAVTSGLTLKFTDQHGEQWDEVLIFPIHGETGEIEHFASYTRDITRQIRAEERLKLATLQLLTDQEDERRRVAQDLHDDLGQRLTAHILNLKAIDGEIEAGRNDEAGNQVKQAIRAVEDMVRHIRQVCYELRPPSFATLPLDEVLKTLCSSLALPADLHVIFSSQEQLLPVPDVHATALYRLVQEGLNNVAKHAQATSVWINLEYADGEVNISVEDDGQGFDPHRRSSHGIGLQGLRERFSMLNGHFDVESAPGRGTRLYGSLPLADPGLN